MIFSPVESSNIREQAYENGTLYLRFRTSEKVYDYPIEEGLYKEFLEAPSKGKFFNQRIRNLAKPPKRETSPQLDAISKAVEQCIQE